MDLESRLRADHPLRATRDLVNEVLAAPARLLRATLLQAFYSICSEWQLMERLDFDLLFRWIAGLGLGDPAWDHATFSKNRDRVLQGDIAARFLSAVLAQSRVKRLLSSEHFSIDGTPVEVGASMKNFKAKDGPGDSSGSPRRSASNTLAPPSSSAGTAQMT